MSPSPLQAKPCWLENFLKVHDGSIYIYITVLEGKLSWLSYVIYISTWIIWIEPNSLHECNKLFDFDFRTKYKVITKGKYRTLRYAWPDTLLVGNLTDKGLVDGAITRFCRKKNSRKFTAQVTSSKAQGRSRGHNLLSFSYKSKCTWGWNFTWY